MLDNEKVKTKRGRKPKIDKANHFERLRLTSEEYGRFLKIYEASGMKTKTDFFKHLIFDKKLKVITVDKGTMESFMVLTKLFSQYRAVGLNYNQVVKALKTNFSEARAKYLIGLQVNYIKELIKITEDVNVKVKKIEEWLQKS